MATWVAGLVALGTIVAVYLGCVRPMRHGHCALHTGVRNTDLDRQFAELRAELRVLRARDEQGGQQ
jgi:hypothetical protein